MGEQGTFSPDGTRIAFLSTGRGTDPDSCDLWVMDARDVELTFPGPSSFSGVYKGKKEIRTWLERFVRKLRFLKTRMP